MIAAKNHTENNGQTKASLICRPAKYQQAKISALYTPVKCPICNSNRLFDVASNICVKSADQSLESDYIIDEIIFIKCQRCRQSVSITL